MSFTFEQAIAALESQQYQSLEGLRNLIRQISVDVSGKSVNAITLFYSGNIGDMPAWQLAEKIGKDSNGKIITIGETPVSNFLNSNEFRNAIQKIVGDDPTILKSILDGQINPDGTRTEGMWDIASRNLAMNAVGDVRTITPFGESSKVFAQTELLTLLENDKVTSIDGVSRLALVELYKVKLSSLSQAAALDAVKTTINYASLSQISDMKMTIETLPDGTVRIKNIDTGSLFEGTNYEGSKLPSNLTEVVKLSDKTGPAILENYQPFVEGARNTQLGYQILNTINKGAKALEHVGTAAVAASYLIAMVDANAAAAAGNTVAARNIMLKWTASTEGGLMAGFASAKLAGEIFSPLLAGGPISEAAWLLLTVGSGIAGGYFGAEAVNKAIDSMLDNKVNESDNLFETIKYNNGVVYTRLLQLPYDEATRTDRWYDRAWSIPNGVGGYTVIKLDSKLGYKEQTVWQGEPNKSIKLSSVIIEPIASDGSVRVTEYQGNHLVRTFMETSLSNGGSRIEKLNINLDQSTTKDVWDSDLQGGVSNHVNTTTSANGNVVTIKVDRDGNQIFESVEVTTTLANNAKDITRDNNNDGKIDQRLFVNPNGVTRDLSKLTDLFDVERSMQLGYNSGWLSSGFYMDFTNWVSSQLTTMVPSITNSVSSLFMYPIGAFYESRTPAVDMALSVADKTFVILDANKKKLTASALASRDFNLDGKLSGTELANLYVWRDFNENGVNESINNEMQTSAQAGITEIRSTDYTFYTQGNAGFAEGVIAMPTKRNEFINTVPSINRTIIVPGSNYRNLRDSDNRYVAILGGGSYWWVDWAANQVKINNSNRTYLIGTDGNDNFDVNLYANYQQYFNLSLLVNFLAGGGDDVMGGSNRDDNLWGGAGNDVLWAYSGNDSLYGEEGNDNLNAADGNDLLDGGVGDDRLSGGNGNDILNGGEGNDLLLGESGNDTLLGGNGNDQLDGGDGNDYLESGSGDDLLLGQNGNDSVVGGVGNNELNGGYGNDQLWADAGNDKCFGGVGNDTIFGGSGDDVILGFTSSNDTKQTLNFGESDDDVIFAGSGMDNVYGGLGNDYIDGGEGDDLLSGDEGADTIWGGLGNDQLLGGSGNDTLMGEEGADRLFGGVGDDVIFGGDGADVILGFNPTNLGAQTLGMNETDNDTIYAGAGDDLIMAGFGKDVVWAGIGNDEIQGGEGDDALYGEEGDDRLFGQVGNDTMYGGNGADLLMGFVAQNENKTSLNAGESDDDFLYGGAGADTLVGGLGNDYLDGGAGADIMEGGAGDDIYIVNSVNDSILEQSNEGYDRVISSVNTILNANIEELRLLEGSSIHGTGNAANNKIIGNNSNNILDGVTGVDTMMGAGGDDTYYVDNVDDVVIELANEGNDTVQSTISYSLANNVENVILLDFSKAEKGLVDDVSILVYGYPKMNELDYSQGDAVLDYQGTCALTSIANLLTQADRVASEAQVVQVAIDNNWTVTDPSLPAYRRGGSNYVQQQALLNNFGVRNQLLMGYNEEAIGNLIRSGRGVILALNAGQLWDDRNYNDDGGVNHVVTITGAAYNESTGSLMGFYIADSGRQKVSDMTRYISLDLFRTAANVANAYAIYTTEALKLWDENVNATGNALNNMVVGNRGNNVLSGLSGNDTVDAGAGGDTLIGGAGNDTVMGGMGDDVYQFARGDGVDVLIENDTTLGNQDTLQFTNAVTYDQLWFSHVGNNLEVSVIGTSDKVIVNNWYLGGQYQVERISAGGRNLSSTNVESLVQAMAGFAVPSAGQITLAQTTLSDVQKNQLSALVSVNWG